jgi:hypothetical protein
MKSKMSPILLIITALIYILILGYVLMLSWNYTLPDIFGFNEITFYQGLVLLVLINILFSGVLKVDCVSNACQKHITFGEEKEEDNYPLLG